MSTSVEISIRRGADLARSILLTDDTTGDPIDLTGATVRADCRERAKGDVLASWTVTIPCPTGLSGSPPVPTPQLILKLPFSVTAPLCASRLIFDVLVTTADGRNFYPVNGVINLLPASTENV